MSETSNTNPVRTARGVAGVIAALMMTGLALTVVTANDVPGSGATGATVVLANNAGPATPPVSP
ncbi:hypothetical protein ABZ371_03415 [Streptomyces sp. NPDC005899]|uniref:hypothetical protein n=1 Tax=Streptomyces sp. NPDC005899 TaxID=3155716 RepID=UPI00340AFF1D